MGARRERDQVQLQVHLGSTTVTVGFFRSRPVVQAKIGQQISALTPLALVLQRSGPPGLTHPPEFEAPSILGGVTLRFDPMEPGNKKRIPN